VLNVFLSVDTDTCAASVRRFNEEAAKREGVAVLCISADLPFAFKRFCGAEGLDKVEPFSTVKSGGAFGKAYGVRLVDGPLEGLHARSIVVIDEAGKVTYTQLVPEPAEHVQSTIKETVAGHLRGIIGTLTLEELYRDQKRFQEKVREEAHTDLEGMGFEFKSFVFREIQDDEGYLNALGQPKIQAALKDARIATANADRDASIGEEGARQQKEQKRLGVDTTVADSE